MNAHPSGDLLIDLSPTAVVSFAGPDATRFLQNQLTNDVSRVDARTSQLTAYCNPKGRMLAILRLLALDDGYAAHLPAEVCGTFIERLTMYRLRSRVEISDRSETLDRFSLAGPGTPELIGEWFGEAPADVHAVASVRGATAVRVPAPVPRFDLFATPAAGASIRAGLADRCEAAAFAAADLLDVRAGIPSVRAETVEAFVPQMTNLDLVGGVSFEKGCFPGQEIVARLRYLGQLKRRTYRLAAGVSVAPPPGGTVVDARDGKTAGKVLFAAEAPGAGVEILCVLEIARAEAGELRLGEVRGPELRTLDLPYALTSTDPPAGRPGRDR